MKTRILVALAAFAAASCTTNQRNSALSITKVVVGSLSGSTCTLSATADETDFPTFNPTETLAAIAAGTPTGNGLAGFVVSNNLSNTANLNTVLRTNTNTFTPHQAVVAYQVVGGASLPEQIIPVSSGTVLNGQTPVAVPLFSPIAIVNALAAFATPQFVRTTTRIEGTLDDGTTVSTSEHDFVVQVCNTAGCPETTCF